MKLRKVDDETNNANIDQVIRIRAQKGKVNIDFVAVILAHLVRREPARVVNYEMPRFRKIKRLRLYKSK